MARKITQEMVSLRCYVCTEHTSFYIDKLETVDARAEAVAKAAKDSGYSYNKQTGVALCMLHKPQRRK